MKKGNAQHFFGIVIQKELLDNRELKLVDKLVYSYIASFKNCCYEPNKVIADKLGISSSSVSHSIAHLSEIGMLFVKRTNGNDASRTLYAVFNNPNKLAYLQKKYSSEGCGKPVENFKGGLQNLLTSSQNLLTPLTGERLAKFATIEYRIKRIKEGTAKIGVSESPSKAMFGAFEGLAKPSRKVANYEKEFYERNTFKLGAN